ncbi:L,D-transpeptidase family protein [Immundisolibacter sp.]|uniref:L,D-transpeptidase family protein n=1 Tax=Immundisolibacter sp. TaxID=1934948 RepID=UPI002636D329|nr:L,D-transpeptidase family protein [Immundisolibacter sp.]MDD3650953.1 L,D-transpeptidase family protein [Immundisolibacter sp.]
MTAPHTWLRSLLPLLGALALHARADTVPLPPSDVDLIGQVKVVTARHEDTLLDIARRGGLGYTEIKMANRGVDPWMPGEGTQVVLPTQHILPMAPREGIVINIPEMRLYYYLPARGGIPQVETYPISIGRYDWRTPLGVTQITQKVPNPTWTPPESIRIEHAAKGDILPPVVPAGPDNPLGQFALRLGVPGYLIHGTNKPYGIGMRVTHGCLRLYPEDIATLFNQVTPGVKVNFVSQPYKIGQAFGVTYLEVHPPLKEEKGRREGALGEIARLLASRGVATADVDWVAVRRELAKPTGIPVPITQPDDSPQLDAYRKPHETLAIGR